MEIKIVKIKKPEDVNIIIGQAHFIKTVEDIFEAITNASASIKFGIAIVVSFADVERCVQICSIVNVHMMHGLIIHQVQVVDIKRTELPSS